MNIFGRVLGASAVFMVLSACQSVFDFAPPHIDHPLGSALTASQVAQSAADYATAYENWVQSLANTPQLVEIPLIGTGIAAAAELGYGKTHKGPTTSLALGGAGLAILDNYYAPRERMLIYLAGSDAMRCIQGIASTVDSTNGGQRFTTLLLGGGAAATNYTALSVLAPNELAASTFQILASQDLRSVQDLKDAIQQINTKIATRSQATSTQPDAGKITSDLKKAMQADINVQHNLTLAMQSLPGINPNTIGVFLETPAVQALVNFNSDVTACVAKAG